MLTLIEEGGFPMWFVLAFGLGTIAYGARFAWRPEGTSPAPVWALGIATFISALAATACDLAAVGHKASDFLRTHPAVTLADVVLQGFAESMAPGIVGFAMTAISAMFIGVGLLRRNASPT